MSDVKVTVGLYRHFKGEYFYVTGLSRRSEDYAVCVNYFNVMHPEMGSYVRPLDDFIATEDTCEQFGDEMTLVIHDRIDNVTGQYMRFERVKDISFQLGSVSTQQLIDELRERKDSPIHQLDLEGLESTISYVDYCVGEVCEGQQFGERWLNGGVNTIASFEKQEDAQNYLATHRHKRTTTVFKRTFIDIND